MAFAVKTEARNPRSKTFAFVEQKTMYGGKHISKGHTVFVFASENEGGQGLNRPIKNRCQAASDEGWSGL
jgi:hypothetical protein